MIYTVSEDAGSGVERKGGDREIENGQTLIYRERRKSVLFAYISTSVYLYLYIFI